MIKCEISVAKIVINRILNGDCRDQIDSYFRPISILLIISKCSEHCVNLQTNKIFKAVFYYLISNLILEKIFHNYLAQDMFDNTYDSKFKGNIPAIIFLCTRKDFDTLDHDI